MDAVVSVLRLSQSTESAALFHRKGARCPQTHPAICLPHSPVLCWCKEDGNLVVLFSCTHGHMYRSVSKVQDIISNSTKQHCCCLQAAYLLLPLLLLLVSSLSFLFMLMKDV